MDSRLKIPFQFIIVLAILAVLATLFAPVLPKSSYAQASAPQKIESDNARVVEEGIWLSQGTPSASGSSYLYNRGASSLSLDFAGPSLEVIYVSGPSLGTLAIEVDGTVLRTVITTDTETRYGQVAKIDYLTDEAHELKVYAQGEGTIAVDAFVISPRIPDPADPSAVAQPVSHEANPPHLPCNPASLVDGIANTEHNPGIALSADGRYFYYGIGNRFFSDPLTLYQLDRQTCLTTSITTLTGGNLYALVASADGQHLFATTYSTIDLPIGFTVTYTTQHVNRTITPATVTQLYSAGFYINAPPIPAHLQGDVSADARYFVTGNAYASIRLFDRTAGTATNLSFGGNPLLAAGRNVRLSGDGRYVFFATAMDFAPASSNSITEIYMLDLQGATMTLISTGVGGARLDGYSDVLDVSDDGRYILYASAATNAVAGDTNNLYDLFVYDRQMGTNTRISVADDESQASGNSFDGRFTSDARLIAFESDASNLVPNDTNSRSDIFLRDTIANTTSLISLSTTGTPANSGSFDPIIAGSAIAFLSQASDLVPGLGNGAFQYVYVASLSVATSFPGDRLALLDGSGNLRLNMNLRNTPISDNYQSYTLTPPANGQGVMGDWDGDGTDTPGIYADGVFYYTNSLSGTPTWSAIWVGLLGRPAVAGRFDNAVNHDCIGAVDNGEFPPYGTAFALYFTCDLTNNTAPTLTFQWLSVVLPDSGGFLGTHQFAAGDFDNNGVDSIAIRRGEFIAFGNVPPTTLLSEFNLAQYWGTPSVTGGDYGLFLTGDFDLVAGDSFGVYYANGNFYYRDSVEWNPSGHARQQINLPSGTITSATTWR